MNLDRRILLCSNNEIPIPASPERFCELGSCMINNGLPSRGSGKHKATTEVGEFMYVLLSENM
jgi:hypothetical protein